MVTTLGWVSADPGTRCGLPGGHGGTETCGYPVSMNIWTGEEDSRSTCTAVPSRPAEERQAVGRSVGLSVGRSNFDLITTLLLHSCILVHQSIRQISVFTSRRYSDARVGGWPCGLY